MDEFQTHRSLLFGIAYRMLGRVAEAEDMVQETFLRWQAQDVAAIRQPRAWLVTAVTRLCLDQLRSARRQREEYYGVWLPEPLVESTAASGSESTAQSDSLTMAFMMMLERLAPHERAVFLLREAFGFDYADVARAVGKSEANCRQIVTRARSHLQAGDGRYPPAPARAEALVSRFFEACNTGNVAELLALLAEDVALFTDGGGRVRAAGRPIHTADRVSRFFIGLHRRGVRPAAVRRVVVNGRTGAIVRREGALDSVVSFDVVDGRIRAIYLVRNPDKLRHVRTDADPGAN